jgi:hypothetical protein
MDKTKKHFWELRALSEGKTYGEKPSVSARLALPYLNDAKNIIEIGGAYGRNCHLFAAKDIHVTNIDLCKHWIALLEQEKDNLPITNICADYLEAKLNRQYQVEFSNFVLHFFKPKELDMALDKTKTVLVNNGLLINSWLSKNDEYAASCHLNQQIYMRCFSKAELKSLHHRHGLKLELITELRELELINARHRKTWFWFTVAYKK